MNIVLCAINAKFIHSSLAIRSLAAYCGEYAENLVLREFTINNSEDFILKEIYRIKPDVLCFSGYIWNIEFIKSLSSSIKKIMPAIKIVIGGPEVSYTPEEIDEYSADILALGEGEAVFKELLSYFLTGGPLLQDIKGIAYKDGNETKTTSKAVLVPLDEIPFVYTDLSDLDNKIMYYESSRGCPFSCGYCLSSVEAGVRFLSLERVYADLRFFIEGKVKQVKFVDRTFNCNKRHALAIWRFIIENDNGYTNFHFEISADLLDDEMLETLKAARAGLIQFEIGVQSTNGETLCAVSRKTNLAAIYDKVIKIKSFGNIHQHLDLIAGLPLEGYDSFQTSFNDVYALKPEMIQLGFLKLLKGSVLRLNAGELGIIFRNSTPYEVLYTNELSYEEMLKLKDIENLVEIYYNSGLFKNVTEFAISGFLTPFDFYEALAGYWNELGYHLVSHQKARIFEIMYEFLSEHFTKDKLVLKSLLKVDMFMNENVKNLPGWMDKTDYSKIKPELEYFYASENNRKMYFKGLEAYNARQLSRMSHIESFHFDIIHWQKTGEIVEKICYILFNYNQSGGTEGVKAYPVEIKGG